MNIYVSICRKQFLKITALIFLFAGGLGFRATAQLPSLDWARQFKSFGQTISSTDFGGYSRAIGRDSLGNVYTMGYFWNGHVDFDPDTAAADTFFLHAGPSGDIFVSKLDAQGHFVWAKKMGGDGIDKGEGMAVDPSGNVYTTGIFSDTAWFGNFSLTEGTGYGDAFICKQDAQGAVLWVKQIGGSTGYSVAVDLLGNVYVTGIFADTIQVMTTSGTVSLNPLNGSVFVAKLDANGNFIWVRQVGNTTTSNPCIAVDEQGNSYLTGDFSGTIDFGSGPGAPELTGGSSSMFICKLDTNGNFIWAKATSGGECHPQAITLDPKGNNIYTTGYIAGAPVDFDPGTDTFFLHPLAGYGDIFVCKWNNQGDFVWAKDFPDTLYAIPPLGLASYAWGRGIAVDKMENVFTTGYFFGIIDLNPDTAIGDTAYFDAHNISTSGFVSKLDAQGNYVWAVQLDYPNNYSRCSGFGVCVDDTGHIYATGGFQFNVNFNPRDTTTLTAMSLDDAFVLKLKDTVAGTPPPPPGSGIATPAALKEQMMLYPNPATGYLRIKDKSAYAMRALVVYNTLGKAVRNAGIANRFDYRLSLAGLPAGHYTIRILCANGSIADKNFVITK